MKSLKFLLKNKTKLSLNSNHKMSKRRESAKLAKKPKMSKQDTPEQIVTIVENDHEEKKTESETVKPKHFKILSWNIDGLDNGSREARTIGVCNKIKK